MTLPVASDLKTMDYSYQGQPFVNVPAKDIDLTTMDYSYQGQPFVGNAYGGTTPPATTFAAFLLLMV